MAITAQERQQAIDGLAQVLLSKTTGHTEAEAIETATAMVDKAIADQESKQT